MATYTVVGNTKVVSSASLLKKTVVIPAIPTTGVMWYKIKVTLDTKYSSTMPTCKDSAGNTVTLTNDKASNNQTLKCTLTDVPYGATVYVAWEATNGYELSKTTQYEIVANKTSSTFTNPTASIITKTITIPAPTNNAQHFTFKVTKGSLGSLPNYTIGSSTTQNTPTNDTESAFMTSKVTFTNVPFGTLVAVSWYSKDGYHYDTDATTRYKVDRHEVSNTTAYTFTVPTATLSYYNLSVGAATNQTYAVSVTANSTYGGTVPTKATDGSAMTGLSAAKTFSCPYGSTAKVVYTGTAKTGYNVTKTADVTKTMTSAQSVPAASATYALIYYTLTVGAATNQTYTISGTANSTYGGTIPTAAARSAAGSWSCPYGSTSAPPIPVE